MSNLKKYREKAHLSQNRLAKKIGCGESFISQVETGGKSLPYDMAVKISPLVGDVDPLEIMGNDVIKKRLSFSNPNVAKAVDAVVQCQWMTQEDLDSLIRSLAKMKELKENSNE